MASERETVKTLAIATADARDRRAEEEDPARSGVFGRWRRLGIRTFSRTVTSDLAASSWSRREGFSLRFSMSGPHYAVAHHFRQYSCEHRLVGSARLSSFNSFTTSHIPFSLTSHMSGQSGPSHFEVLFEAAFRDYEDQTGKTLANHSLAKKFQSCDSVESVTAVLREQIETSSEARGKEKVLKPLKNVLLVLHKLSSASAINFGQHLGLVRPLAPVGFRRP
jgi:hypothetical protein